MPIYHLRLRGPLHVGEAVAVDREAVLDWLPSDSLFSAIVSAWSAGGADVSARLEAFQTRPPFLLTSAFPWASGIHFFPAPAAMPRRVELEGKRAKRIRWVSEGVFRTLTRGAAAAVGAGCLLHGETVWVMPKERSGIPHELEDEDGQPRLWQTYVVPRVAVGRTSNTSNLFHTGRVTYAPGGGLWFSVRGPTDWVDDALLRLADSGLGGLRNYGHGAFEPDQAPDDLLSEADTGPALCLSRYAPADAEEIRSVLQDRRAAYRLITVRGWCTDDAGHGWRRRSVRMIAEGALIPDPARARGKLVQVQPVGVRAFENRPVLRHGLPFLVRAGQLAEEEPQ